MHIGTRAISAPKFSILMYVNNSISMSYHYNIFIFFNEEITLAI